MTNRRLSSINRIEESEGVDLEVSAMQVDVDAANPNEEFDEGFFLLGWVG